MQNRLRSGAPHDEKGAAPDAVSGCRRPNLAAPIGQGLMDLSDFPAAFHGYPLVSDRSGPMGSTLKKPRAL